MEDFLNDYAGEGLENINLEDQKTPFLVILQILSPPCQRDNDAFVKGAEPGMFFNTALRKLYGRKINVIPLAMKKVWLEWKPNRGGLVDRHEPNSIPVDKTDFTEWKFNGNIIQENYMFFCLIEGHFKDGIVILSLASSGIKHAKNWNTMIVNTKLPGGKPAPIFSSVWELESVKNTNDQGSWYQLGEKATSIKRTRYITPSEFKEKVLEARNQAKTINEPDLKQLEDMSKVQGEERKEIPY